MLSKPLSSSKDSYLFYEDLDKGLLQLQEQVNLIHFNSPNEVISWRCVNTGSMGHRVFDIKLTLSCALNCMALGIMMTHIHLADFYLLKRFNIN
ncbi:hypothetical protein EON73_01740 [bacterium]|nr:MAG: hypothetical protein EON73_01740 [bacterium]